MINLRPRFISGVLAILSITSLALLRLKYLAYVMGRPTGRMEPFDLHSVFAGSSSMWWTDFANDFLLLTLVLTALFSLFSFRRSRRSEDAG